MATSKYKAKLEVLVTDISKVALFARFTLVEMPIGCQQLLACDIVTPNFPLPVRVSAYLFEAKQGSLLLGALLLPKASLPHQ